MDIKSKSLIMKSGKPDELFLIWTETQTSNGQQATTSKIDKQRATAGTIDKRQATTVDGQQATTSNK